MFKFIFNTTTLNIPYIFLENYCYCTPFFWLQRNSNNYDIYLRDDLHVAAIITTNNNKQGKGQLIHIIFSAKGFNRCLAARKEGSLFIDTTNVALEKLTSRLYPEKTQTTI